MNIYVSNSIILSCSCLLIAFLYGICNNQIRTNKDYQWPILYLGFILGIEIISKVSIYLFRSETTQYIYPIYVSGEFFILTGLSLSALNADKRWLLFTSLIACYMFTETIILWSLNNDATTGYAKIISHLTILCLLAFILIKTLKEFETYSTSTILYTALFLYYGVSLFLFLLMSQLTENNVSIWILNNFLSSFLYACFFYTFYKVKHGS